MTRTGIDLNRLQQEIPHLAQVSEDGWLLKWGDSSNTAFEIVCRKANAMQVKNLDDLISRAMPTALETLK